MFRDLKAAVEKVIQDGHKATSVREKTARIPLWDRHAAERIAQILVQRWTP